VDRCFDDTHDPAEVTFNHLPWMLGWSTPWFCKGDLQPSSVDGILVAGARGRGCPYRARRCGAQRSVKPA